MTLQNIEEVFISCINEACLKAQQGSFNVILVALIILDFILLVESLRGFLWGLVNGNY